MNHIKLADFLDRTTVYEQWRAPLNPELRRGVWRSVASLLLTLIVLWCLPMLTRVVDPGYFLVGGTLYTHSTAWMITQTGLLSGGVLGTLGGALVMLVVTRGLQTGRRRWHWAGLAVVVAGVIPAAGLALLLTLILFNLALWLLIGVTVVGTTLLIIVALTGGGREEGN